MNIEINFDFLYIHLVNPSFYVDHNITCSTLSRCLYGIIDESYENNFDFFKVGYKLLNLKDEQNYVDNIFHEKEIYYKSPRSPVNLVILRFKFDDELIIKSFDSGVGKIFELFFVNYNSKLDSLAEYTRDIQTENIYKINDIKFETIKIFS